MGKVDLHLHSHVSDGVLSPSELVEKAVGLGLTVIALTDHDNVDGIAPAMETARDYPSLTFIPGVEISADIEGGEVHMLGYFVDHTNREFLDSLDAMRNDRVVRAEQMVAKLNDLGLALGWDRVLAFAGTGSVGRPHIAQALLEQGHIGSVQEAFEKYLAFNGPAYVHREKITPKDAIDMIGGAGGIPVLAHPLTKGRKDPEDVIAGLAKDGLAGLEIYYKDYSLEDRSYLLTLARRYGLIATGGTDYHGLDEKREMRMGESGVPPEIVTILTELYRKKQGSKS